MDDMGDDIMSASYGAAPPAPLPANDHHFAGEKITASSDEEGPAPLPMADQGKVNHGDRGDLEEELFGGDDEEDDAVDEGQVLDEAEPPEPRSDAAYDQAHAAAHAGEDLFDDDDDEEAEEEKVQQPSRPVDEYGQEITEEEWAKRRKLEYEEEEGEEVYGAHEDVTAEVTVANIPTPFSTDDKVWDLRIPSFLSIVHDPYTEEMIEDEELVRGRLPVQDESIARWRWVAAQDGTTVRQSNARVVVWSDGSRSLQLGSELYDMVQQVDHSAAIQRAPTAKPDPSASTQHAAALSAAPKPDFANQAHPLTYLFAQHDYARMLEAQAPIYGQIALRPSGTSSLAHKTFVSRAIARPVAPSSSAPDALVGLRKTKQIAVTIDPEMEKAQREAAEMKKAREAKKLAAAERRKAQGKPGQQGRGVRRQKFNARLFSDEEEGLDGGAEDWDDDEDAEGEEGSGRRRAGGARRNPKRGTGGIYDEKDDDDSGFVVPDTESEGDAEGEQEEAEEEEEEAEEEEEEEGSDGGEDKPSSRAKRAARANDADDLEAADRQIEDRARAEKRRKIEADDALDADGGGGRRRMIIESDDEE